jgi:predicted tellurium resistance membrane protein TerC
MLFAIGVSIIYLLIMLDRIVKVNSNTHPKLVYLEDIGVLMVGASLIHFGINHMI